MNEYPTKVRVVAVSTVGWYCDTKLSRSLDADKSSLAEVGKTFKAKCPSCGLHHQFKVETVNEEYD